MRHQQHGGLEIFLDLAQRVVEFGAQRSVEARGRFVEQQQFRLADQRARDGAALALASGNLVRAAAGGFGEMEVFEHFGDAAMALETRTALGGKHQVLAQRHVRKQRVVLEHVAAIALLRRKNTFDAPS